MRSPQHPNQQIKYHMDANNMNSNMDKLRLDETPLNPNVLYDQQHQTASTLNTIKSKFQTKLQYSPSNNNYQFNDTSATSNELRMRQSLELRRQEILGKLKQFKQSNGNHRAYHITSTTNESNKNNNIITNTINNNTSAPTATTTTSTSTDKNDLVNNYWNTAISSNDYGYHQTLQQPIRNNNQTQILLDNQCQNSSIELNRDIFLRSDSILTDDDCVPFEAPAQSKFGPISRMSAKTTQYTTTKNDDAVLNQTFFNDTNSTVNNLRISTENIIPTSTQTSIINDQTSVWLNSLQKSPNHNYQTNELTPFKTSIYSHSPESMLNDNIQRDGKLF